MEQMYICLAIFAIMVILFLSRKIPMAFSALIAMVLPKVARALLASIHPVMISSRLSQDADD